MSKNILLVATSAAEFNGKATGVYMSELAHPYYAFSEAGHTVSIASIKGGKITVDNSSLPGDDECQKFLKEHGSLLDGTPSVASVDASTFDAVYCCGGHGACTDFDDAGLATLLTNTHAQGKLIAAVCHGVLALNSLKAPDGKALVAGKKVTGFSEEEETAIGGVEWVGAHLPERAFRALGANYVKADDVWGVCVASEDRIFTGQNPASAGPLAKAVMASM